MTNINTGSSRLNQAIAALPPEHQEPFLAAIKDARFAEFPLEEVKRLAREEFGDGVLWTDEILLESISEFIQWDIEAEWSSEIAGMIQGYLFADSQNMHLEATIHMVEAGARKEFLSTFKLQEDESLDALSDAFILNHCRKAIAHSPESTWEIVMIPQREQYVATLKEPTGERNFDVFLTLVDNRC